MAGYFLFGRWGAGIAVVPIVAVFENAVNYGNVVRVRTVVAGGLAVSTGSAGAGSENIMNFVPGGLGSVLFQFTTELILQLASELFVVGRVIIAASAMTFSIFFVGRHDDDDWWIKLGQEIFYLKCERVFVVKREMEHDYSRFQNSIPVTLREHALISQPIESHSAWP